MIDRKPQVGRYLVKDTVWNHGFCYRGGLITKISGKRIYINCEYGSPGYERVESEYVNKFAAICDTHEEMKMLLAFDSKCREDHKELDKKQFEEWRDFFKEAQ